MRKSEITLHAEHFRAPVRKYKGVVYVAKGHHAPASFNDPCTCGACGRTWDDSVVTGLTPAPSARCPFEHMHKESR